MGIISVTCTSIKSTLKIQPDIIKSRVNIGGCALCSFWLTCEQVSEVWWCGDLLPLNLDFPVYYVHFGVDIVFQFLQFHYLVSWPIMGCTAPFSGGTTLILRVRTRNISLLRTLPEGCIQFFQILVALVVLFLLVIGDIRSMYYGTTSYSALW